MRKRKNIRRWNVLSKDFFPFSLSISIPFWNTYSPLVEIVLFCQLKWLSFSKMSETFSTNTSGGKNVCLSVLPQGMMTYNVCSSRKRLRRRKQTEFLIRLEFREPFEWGISWYTNEISCQHPTQTICPSSPTFMSVRPTAIRWILIPSVRIKSNSNNKKGREEGWGKR